MIQYLHSYLKNSAPAFIFLNKMQIVSHSCEISKQNPISPKQPKNYFTCLFA